MSMNPGTPHRFTFDYKTELFSVPGATRKSFLIPEGKATGSPDICKWGSISTYLIKPATGLRNLTLSLSFPIHQGGLKPHPLGKREVG